MKKLVNAVKRHVRDWIRRFKSPYLQLGFGFRGLWFIFILELILLIDALNKSPHFYFWW